MTSISIERVQSAVLSQLELNGVPLAADLLTNE